MRVAVSRRPITPGKHATPVTDMQGVTDVGIDEALCAPHVEHPGGAAQDHGQDVGVAGVVA